MKRLIVSSSFLVLFVALAFSKAALADHEERRGQVIEAAHELDEAASHFHKLAHDLTGYSYIANDAHHFAKAADHFHDMVERRTLYGHLAGDFNYLKNRYYYLRKNFYRAHHARHNWRLLRDWYQVEWAWEYLYWNMTGRLYD